MKQLTQSFLIPIKYGSMSDLKKVVQVTCLMAEAAKNAGNAERCNAHAGTSW